MRRGTLTLFAAAGLTLVPASAHAARLETWLTTSRHVDPKPVRFNGPADRPKALRVNVLLPDGYDSGASRSCFSCMATATPTTTGRNPQEATSAGSRTGSARSS